ncbi:MAG: glycosyltransferase [Paludibacteraceae bacterium]|nr:glycosyltransferase [Paludibacteraceae bacterium]MBP6283879.1 glycosyltransferase [Paludibacteraceae bacterium]
MKILIIGKSFPYKGGIAAFNERLAMQLMQEGHAVEIYTYSYIYSFLTSNVSDRFNDNDKPIDDIVIKQKINNFNPLKWEKVITDIQKEEFELIIYGYADVADTLCISYIAKRLHKKIIQLAVMHNVEVEQPLAQIKKMAIKMMVSQLDGCIVMSNKVKKELQTYNKKNRPVLFSPHPIYDFFGKGTEKKMAMLQLGLNTNYQYVLFFGAIKESKGLDLLIEAFADERVRELPVKLLVVGDFHNNKELYTDMMYENRLKNDIIFIDEYVPNHVVSLYFSACSIVGQPYREVNQSGILQVAYHFNKPILITNIAECGISIPHQKVGYVVKPDVTEIADSLVDFFHNKREEEMITNVKEEKKKFLWNNMTEALLNLHNTAKAYKKPRLT